MSPTSSEFLDRVPPVYAVALSILATSTIAMIDVILPANIAVPIAYSGALVLSLYAHSIRFTWSLAAVQVALTWALLVWGPGPTFPAAIPFVISQRTIVSVMLALLALLCHSRVYLYRQVKKRQAELESQARELEILNEELSQREEEIVRQNEEMHSQTEELERQTEELRITNEELSARERSLEQLLELSRSLTAGLTRGEMLDKICESLGVLCDGAASAIIERRGSEIEIICHHGFGPAGPKSKLISYSSSFSALIMSMGQTGYLENVDLRPELIVPQPVDAVPFRAVLATPLRMQGRAVGTVEVYAYQPRKWDGSLITLIESLAAQASISLQNFEMVEAIRQERRRFEAAFRNVPFGLAVCDDPQGDNVQVNPAAASILGVPLGENISATTPVGSRLRRGITRKHIPVPESDLPLARALRGQELQGEELELSLPRGVATLLFCAAPFLDSDGNVNGAVASFADITELKRVQRELDLRRREAEEASIRKTRFLSAVSHDIRTPANAINLMAELIRRASTSEDLKAELPDLAQRLQANTRSLMDLVGDLLDVARFDSGRVELVETQFMLGELIADECRQLSLVAEAKGLTLEADPLERPIRLFTDRVKLGRVIGNLLGNAIKFTNSGGVRISAGFMSPVDRRVVIRVQDTGQGIAVSSLNRIFDEFAQLQNPERDSAKGYGLGLTICKRLIEVMGGEIVVESEVGKGSTFMVVLPASCVVVNIDSVPVVNDHAPSLAHRNGNRLHVKVLLVEDHPATRSGTSALLRQEGATVIEASNGHEAFHALEAETFDVLLLDMMLPDLDGREILARLQAKPLPSLKGVLVLTGDLTAERLADVKRLGADGLIGKPVDLARLVATIEEFQQTKLPA